MTDETTTTTASEELTRFPAAYAQLLDEIRQVPDAELVAINVDIIASVATVLGALPEIRNLRTTIAAALSDFDLVQFDKLETYALAAGHANAIYRAASDPAESLEALSDAGTKLRELLLADATALAQRGRIDGARLKELRGSSGYRNLASDLLTLATLLRQNWSKISAKTSIELKELTEAEILADRLVTAFGLREQGPAVVAEATINRQRAFTLLTQSYHHARRAISYLRWKQDDADEIVPSLYAGRGGSAKRKPTPTTEPSAPAPDAAPSSTTPAATTPHPDVSSKVGLPDSSPFVNQ